MQGAFALIGVWHGAVIQLMRVGRTTGMRNRANVHTRVSRGAHQVLRGGSKSSRPCRENHPRDRPFKFALLLAS